MPTHTQCTPPSTPSQITCEDQAEKKIFTSPPSRRNQTGCKNVKPKEITQTRCATPKRKFCQENENPSPLKMPRILPPILPPASPPKREPLKDLAKKSKKKQVENPHPHFGLQIFMKLEDGIKLMRHNGMKKSTKKKQAKKIENPKHMLLPPPGPPSQIPSNKKRRSENFEENLRIFQKLEHSLKTENCPKKKTTNPTPPPSPEIEASKQSCLDKKFVPKVPKMKERKATKGGEEIEIASRLLLCDGSQKINKCDEEKLCPPPAKSAEHKRMPPPNTPPHQLPSTAGTNHVKIQNQGGNTPTNQSEERTNFSGPRTTLIGRRLLKK